MASMDRFFRLVAQRRLRIAMPLAVGLLLCGAIVGLLARRQPSAIHAQQPDGPRQTLKDQIIFLSPEGHVRVLDATLPNGAIGNAINWRSPAEHGAWTAIAVGDFNGDGDDEIVAVRADSSSGFNLAVYDPVVAPGADVAIGEVQFFDGIPWRTLFTTTIAGALGVVTAGNFDPNTPGDEIFFSYRSADAATPGFRLQIIRRAPGDRDGTAWEAQTPPLRTHTLWTSVDAGDIDINGVDEIVLTDREGDLYVYRVEGASLSLIFENVSRARPWTDAAIGQFFPGGPREVAASRSATSDLPRFFVFTYDPTFPGNFRDGYFELFAPSPQRVFFADINGNGDDEVFLLRDSVRNPPAPTPTPAPRPHLIMRNQGGDTLPAFEVVLAEDSGYKAGAGGDFDGDGRDEVVVARSEHLLIFNQPEIDTTSRTVITSATNPSLLRVGNLDRLGVFRFPALLSAPLSLSPAPLPAGQGGAISVVTINTQFSDVAAPFTVTVVGEPGWLRVTPIVAQTPANLEVSFNAYGLQPLRTYEATILITTPPDLRITNSPYAIPVRLEVLPGIWPQPTAVLGFAPCGGALPTPPPTTTTSLAIGGLFNVPYSVQLRPTTATWVTFTAHSSILPATLDFVFDPANRPANTELVQANLEIESTTNLGERRNATVPVEYLCERARLQLPLITNQEP